jgi:hypothetical protein
MKGERGERDEMVSTGQAKNDLRDRTRRYTPSFVRLYCGLPRKREEVDILGRQFIRSGTSVAANYREASRARGDGDFSSYSSFIFHLSSFPR